ncbi:hypothetical protein L1887_42484 [Cichorium endivia]|nr:hypothetical protein L1887_42484 [Cichorium endivia]
MPRSRAPQTPLSRQAQCRRRPCGHHASIGVALSESRRTHLAHFIPFSLLPLETLRSQSRLLVALRYVSGCRMVNGRGARRSAVLVGLQDLIRPFLPSFSFSLFLQDFGEVLMVAANSEIQRGLSIEWSHGPGQLKGRVGYPMQDDIADFPIGPTDVTPSTRLCCSTQSRADPGNEPNTFRHDHDPYDLASVQQPTRKTGRATASSGDPSWRCTRAPSNNRPAMAYLPPIHTLWEHTSHPSKGAWSRSPSPEPVHHEATAGTQAGPSAQLTPRSTGGRATSANTSVNAWRPPACADTERGASAHASCAQRLPAHRQLSRCRPAKRLGGVNRSGEVPDEGAVPTAEDGSVLADNESGSIPFVGGHTGHAAQAALEQRQIAEAERRAREAEAEANRAAAAAEAARSQAERQAAFQEEEDAVDLDGDIEDLDEGDEDVDFD